MSCKALRKKEVKASMRLEVDAIMLVIHHHRCQTWLGVSSFDVTGLVVSLLVHDALA
jgi:hypothetical protein